MSSGGGKWRHADWLEEEQLHRLDLSNVADASAAWEAMRNDMPMGISPCPFAQDWCDGGGLLSFLVRRQTQTRVFAPETACAAVCMGAPSCSLPGQLA